MDKPCCKCGERARRGGGDSMCRECRNEYVRLWKARRRHGASLKNYNPSGPRIQQKVVYSPKRRVTATPPVGK